MDKYFLKFVKIMIGILFLSGLLIGLSIGSGKECVKESQRSDNFISAYSSPIFIKNETMASMSNDIDIILLAEKIIQCESGWDYTAQNPNSTAYGAGQFLDGTWNYVQKKWDIKLDRYNKEDQLYAMVRLLEEEGTRHWKASAHCWDKEHQHTTSN
jgi:hypothetical protein